ncbi:PheS-related mystery ligase SrmL [Arthrobacter russicus]|jgi:phenylalanyl-tRNA synthetase alpha chain|uniref:Phenylalanyl-tRNA synthetase alpha chain n=1 Tax=Arthrobacter russicus TaxID=172040 RepID=A0ABU1JCL8_9MICC|nr:hypothetical protein [Arthrobacter russicus]MDR6270172.1 phenylalanyl-tRNA synthetase alpha chain [Arthrobacter russicus]
METPYLSLTELNQSLAIRDLSDPAQNPADRTHAMQELLAQILESLDAKWRIPQQLHRLSPLVSVRDNYDRLGYSPAATTRDARYTRQVSPTVMLRSHTSAGIPALLDSLAGTLEHYDQLHVLPGLVYRRDSVDRTHVGTPHQLDLWRLKSRGLLGLAELEEMMALVAESVLPGCQWRATPTRHPYTAHGHQLDVLVGGEWLELAECGLIAAPILRAAALDPRRWCGLAMGLGLDRALMLRKGIDDIRLLRSTEPRAQRQLEDLQPWQQISVMPPMRRDLSIVCPPDVDAETLGDLARAALGADAEVLAELEVLEVTAAAALPAAAVARLGVQPNQSNALIRLTLQALDRTLTVAEANRLRDRVYVAVHQGPVLELIAG